MNAELKGAEFKKKMEQNRVFIKSKLILSNTKDSGDTFGHHSSRE